MGNELDASRMPEQHGRDTRFLVSTYYFDFPPPQGNNMAGRGSTCPGCGKLTFHDKGSYDQCSKCNYIGWSWKKGVSGVGKGKGNSCPNCENQTLHKVLVLDGGQAVRRCGVCDYSGIEPAPTG